LSWVFVLAAFAKQFLVPLAAIVFFGARDDGSLWGLLFVIPLLVAAIWRQMAFRYAFEADSLLIRDGWLFRNVRRIDYRRIENIDTERGLLHQLFDVAEVRIESSTGGKAEGRMRVLSLEAVQELRERIFDERSRTAPAAEPATQAKVDEPQVLLHLTPGELLRYGLIDNRGLVLVVAFVGLLLQANLIDWARNDLIAVNESIAALGTGMLVALAIAPVAVLLVVTRLLSIGWAVVTLYDFTLTRQASDLRVSYGLLTRVALTLRLPRIQSVRQTQTLLHRWFDRVALTVDSAGDGVNSEQQDGRQAAPRLRWLAPICTPDTAAEIIRMALPMTDATADPDWRPLAPGARGRIFRKTLLATAAILGAPAAALLSWGSVPTVLSSLLLPLLVPLAWWRAVTYTRNARWALTRDVLMFRSGWLTRHLHIVPRNRVQAVKIRVSPLDRRQRMGTLIVDTAGAGATSGPVRIPYLESDTVARLAQALYRLEGDEFPISSPAPR